MSINTEKKKGKCNYENMIEEHNILGVQVKIKIKVNIREKESIEVLSIEYLYILHRIGSHL